MASYTNNTSDGSNKGIQPKITLYTNHGCPFAHRAHIVLKELGFVYEEVIIDLDKPREPWYLEINPRGLVPSLKYSIPGLYEDEIITESAIVAQFLADSRPSHLLPSSLHDPFAPLFRARVAFFTDAWNSKVQPNLYPILTAATNEEKEAKVQETLAAIEKEIEPLLHDAKPFFGGNERYTLAEAIVAPFLLRFYALSNDDLLPKTLRAGIEKLPNTGKWAERVLEQESLLYIWDEEKVVSRTATRIAKLKEAKK